MNSGDHDKDMKSSLTAYSEDMLALMPGHVYWKDRNGILQGCNNLLAKTLGLSSRHEIVGKSSYDISQEHEAEAILTKDFSVINSGVGRTDEEFYMLPNGNKAIYLTERTPIFNENHEVVGLIGISFDITERKKMEDFAEKTKQQLNGMTLVTATIAHELRTPLAAIKSAAKGIKQIVPYLVSAYQTAIKNKLEVKHVSPERIKLLEDVVSNLEKKVDQSNMVIDMLLENIKNRGVELTDFELCSARSCIQKALGQYVFPDDKPDIIFDKNEDFIFYGKEMLVMHIFYNLLKNALYFIKKVGRGEIYIWIKKTTDWNEIHFKDTAMGIEAEHLPKIFEDFFTTGVNKGTGIGLSFCKKTMQAIGGDIKCQSIYKEYAEFILLFPVQTNQELHHIHHKDLI